MEKNKMMMDDRFKTEILNKILSTEGDILIIRETLIDFKKNGMTKSDMIRNLEELRNNQNYYVENIILDLMDFIEGFCMPNLSIF